MQVLEVQADELRQTQSRRVEQLHDRLVAHAQARVRPELEQSRHQVGVDGFRQALARFGRLHAQGRIRAQRLLPHQVPEEAAHRAQSSLNRTW
jgi:hypothetical protein